ncbi:ATP-binding protein [Rubellicoccus peritrichatus]|uniref:histidine kinase n=1 Tax=Rubellicoccus peritrichatus TaxID=3080537 RepID=A0AAQ3LB29_9BACT|nr:ATP-binding protein [Puniceicoccus sp. CR14]WOO42012.1 ATP-binding protein [Puniceicoccus sp. CR14]
MTSSDQFNDASAKWRVRYERERKARKAAEQLLENKSHELWKSNNELADQRDRLEKLVEERMGELKRLSLVAAKTANGVIITDDIGGTLWINEGFTRVTGYTIDDLIGRKPGELLQGPQTDQDTVQIIRDAIAQRKSFNVELINYTKEGRPYWIRIDADPILNDEGLLTQYIAIETDITDQKNAEHALEEAIIRAENAAIEAAEANKAKSLFLANMSHEIRTPLNGVLGYAQLLLQSPNLTEKDRAQLDVVQRNGEHLLALINDILDLSKIEAGKMQIMHAPIDLPQLFSGVAELFTLKAAQKGLNLSFLILDGETGQVWSGGEIPNVLGDAKAIRQILVNLVGNAIKFTDSGSVNCALSIHSNCRYTFVVEDEGIGIEASEVNSIFRPFEQSSSNAVLMEGTGLGLAISANLVELMGGELTVNSTKGIGSIFSFTLHLESTEAVARNASSTTQSPWKQEVQQSKRVLIVDDNESSRNLLKDILEPLGFGLAFAENGRTGLKMAESFGPDLILTDIRMPDMDGHELCRKVRSMKRFSHTRIVAVSANVLDLPSERHRSFDDFLLKPIGVDNVINVVNKMLSDNEILKSVSVAKSVAAKASVTVSDAILKPMLEAAMIGDINALKRQVSNIDASDTELGHFRETVSTYCDKFQIDALCRYLESVQSDKEG